MYSSSILANSPFDGLTPQHNPLVRPLHFIGRAASLEPKAYRACNACFSGQPHKAWTTLSIAFIHVETKQGSYASTGPPARASFLSTLTMPFSLCLLQKEPFSSPFQLKAGLVLQPFSAHLRCLTFTMPSCRRQTAALNTWGTRHDFEVLLPQRHLRNGTFARLHRMM